MTLGELSDQEIRELVKNVKRISTEAKRQKVSVPGLKRRIKAHPLKYRPIEIDGMKFLIIK